MARDDAATHAAALGGDHAHCEAARRYARDQGTPLVAVLVDRGLAEDDALAERLADAVGTVVIELGRGELDVSVLPLAGAELAWRHFLLPIAIAGPSLSVAFADPLDRDAVKAIEEASGRSIEPLVAPLSELRESLTRHYGPAPKSSQPTSSESGSSGSDSCESGSSESGSSESGSSGSSEPMSPEATKKVEGIAFERSGTEPLHRIEDDATMEQRHRALLLTLVDAGVLTHEAYLAALRRVLGQES